MTIKSGLFIAFIVIAVISCAIPLQPGAGSVQLIYTEPNKEKCHFIGQASASDGGMVSGDFMPDARIHRSTANIMKNKAYEMGGNVVYIQQQFNKNKNLSKSLTNQTMQGFVFYCQGIEYTRPEEGE